MPKKIEPKRLWMSGGWEPEFSFLPDEEKELRDIVDDDTFIDRLRDAGAYHRLVRKNDSDAPKKREVSAALDELESSLGQFLYSIRTLDDKTATVIEHEWMKASGNIEDIPRLGPGASYQLKNLHHLHTAIVLAKREVETWSNQKKENAGHVLARYVAEIFAEYGIQVFKKENGTYNRCLAIVSRRNPQATYNWARWWEEEQNALNNR